MEKWEAALKDHQAGMKYQEIADKYGVSLSAVKSWASRKWKQKTQKKVATKARKKLQPPDEKPQPKKRPGAPPGNRNAVGNRGGGAPPGNRNNYRHGFFIDVLSEEERQMIEKRGEISEEQRLLNELNLWELRERHLLETISRQRAIASGLAVHKVKRGDETTMEYVNALEYIMELEEKLNRAQQGYTRAIEALHRIRLDKGTDNELTQEDTSDFVKALISVAPAQKWEEEPEE